MRDRLAKDVQCIKKTHQNTAGRELISFNKKLIKKQEKKLKLALFSALSGLER
jgi:hypothetical protein